jgi:hypothetical protein
MVRYGDSFYDSMNLVAVHVISTPNVVCKMAARVGAEREGARSACPDRWRVRSSFGNIHNIGGRYSARGHAIATAPSLTRIVHVVGRGACLRGLIRECVPRR